MARVDLGLRWLSCGWRLFRRNPWLLTGMGLCGGLVITALAWIPLLASPVIALLAPIFLMSTYLALDGLTLQNAKSHKPQRINALKQSPRELLGVLRREDWLIPAAVVALYSLVVAVLASILMLLVAGSAWSYPWMSLDVAAQLRVLAAALLALLIYLLLAASLIYALPLVFFQKQPLVPAIGRSLTASMRHAPALLVMATPLLLPFVAGTMASYHSPWVAYAAALAAEAFVLPVVAAGLYCSYRTIVAPR